MKPSALPFSLSLALAALLSGACIVDQEPDRGMADHPEELTDGIQFHAVAAAGQGVFTLVNQSKRPIGYWGYGPENPQLWIERETDAGWEEIGWDWCGTGLERHALQPGASVSFQCSFGGDARPLRLATHVYDLDAPKVLHKIWSNGVQPIE